MGLISSQYSSDINIPSRSMNYGNISTTLENPKEKYSLKLNQRKNSCDSNISNISGIFQKALNSHMKIKTDDNLNNNSTISTNDSINGSSYKEEKKK